MGKSLMAFCLFALLPSSVSAQEKIVYPEISYAGLPQELIIGGLTASGVDNYEDYVLTGISKLSVGIRPS